MIYPTMSVRAGLPSGVSSPQVQFGKGRQVAAGVMASLAMMAGHAKAQVGPPSSSPVPRGEETKPTVDPQANVTRIQEGIRNSLPGGLSDTFRSDFQATLTEWTAQYPPLLLRDVGRLILHGGSPSPELAAQLPSTGLKGIDYGKSVFVPAQINGMELRGFIDNPEPYVRINGKPVREFNAGNIRLSGHKVDSAMLDRVTIGERKLSDLRGDRQQLIRALATDQVILLDGKVMNADMMKTLTIDGVKLSDLGTAITINGTPLRDTVISGWGELKLQLPPVGLDPIVQGMPGRTNYSISLGKGIRPLEGSNQKDFNISLDPNATVLALKIEKPLTDSIHNRFSISGVGQIAQSEGFSPSGKAQVQGTLNYDLLSSVDANGKIRDLRIAPFVGVGHIWGRDTLTGYLDYYVDASGFYTEKSLVRGSENMPYATAGVAVTTNRTGRNRFSLNGIAGVASDLKGESKGKMAPFGGAQVCVKSETLGNANLCGGVNVTRAYGKLVPEGLISIQKNF